MWKGNFNFIQWPQRWFFSWIHERGILIFNVSGFVRRNIKGSTVKSGQMNIPIVSWLIFNNEFQISEKNLLKRILGFPVQWFFFSNDMRGVEKWIKEFLFIRNASKFMKFVDGKLDSFKVVISWIIPYLMEHGNFIRFIHKLNFVLIYKRRVGFFLLLLISMEILSEFGAYLYENICDIKNHELNFLFSRVEFMNLNWFFWFHNIEG